MAIIDSNQVVSADVLAWSSSSAPDLSQRARFIPCLWRVNLRRDFFLPIQSVLQSSLEGNMMSKTHLGDKAVGIGAAVVDPEELSHLRDSPEAGHEVPGVAGTAVYQSGDHVATPAVHLLHNNNNHPLNFSLQTL